MDPCPHVQLHFTQAVDALFWPHPNLQHTVIMRQNLAMGFVASAGEGHANVAFTVLSLPWKHIAQDPWS